MDTGRIVTPWDTPEHVSKLLFNIKEEMPRYEYNCVECKRNKEVIKSFNDADTVELCEQCGSAMNKVYSTFGIQFKGGGFYSTGG